jgi:Phosphatase
VTRRPKSRLPPKLPDRSRQRAPAAVKEPSRRERLKDAHVAGRSARFTRDDVARVVHGVVSGDTARSLGVPMFATPTIEHASAAIEAVYGWDGEGTRARIDPAKTLGAFECANDRIVEVAQRGGKLAFATARPASMLGVYRALAAGAAHSGGIVLEAAQSSFVDGGDVRLWWQGGVAVVTDGESLLAYDAAAAAEEFLFVLSRPDLVVADGWFAGVALAAGLEVVATADLDAVALALAAWYGMAIRVIPLDQSRPPGAYFPLLEALDEAVATPDQHDPLLGLAGRSGADGPRSGS